MADVVKATLYWNANEAYALGGITNVALTRMTAAQSHDGSDLTYSQLYAEDNPGAFEEMDATFRHRFNLDTCAVGTISKVVVTIRGKRTGSAAGVSASVKVDLNGIEYGTEQYLGSTFANKTFEFTTDPTDSTAWTDAKVNAKKWGVYGYLSCACGEYDRTGNMQVSEYKVEVYGPENQTGYGTTADEAAAAQDGVGTPGAVTGSAQTADANDVGQDGIGAPGAISGTAETAQTSEAAQGGVGVPGAATATGQTAPERSAAAYTEAQGGVMVPELGVRVPDVETALYTREDEGCTPVTLRDRDSRLRDQKWETFWADTKMGPYDGNLTVQFAGLGNDSVQGVGAISGVVFHCLARIWGEHSMGEPLPTASNPLWHVASQNVAFDLPPVGGWGLLGCEVDYADCKTGLVTTKDGVSPWTWDDILAATALHNVTVHVHHTAIAVPCALEVCEVWAEVHGPVGSQPEQVVLRQAVGQPVRKTFTLGRL